MPYRAAGGNASGWAIMMSLASPSAAARDSPSALMILARFPARPRPGDHGPFHGVVRRGGRIIPAESPSFDLRQAGALLHIKKIRASRAPANVTREQLPGSGAIFLYYHTFRILEFGVDYSAADSGADRSADPHRFPPARKPMQPTAATVFQIGLRLRFPECIMIRTSSCGTQLINVGAKPPFAYDRWPPNRPRLEFVSRMAGPGGKVIRQATGSR
jgi:hypothetical protein